MSPTRLITLEQGAETLGVSTKTLRRMIARGEVPAYRVGARLIRLDANELQQLVRPIPTRAAWA